MSLRVKVLGLFLLLAAVPLVGLGAFEYWRSHRAVETLLASQNARIAGRVAEVIEGRAALLESDLLLLSENAETQRWLNRRGDGEPEEAPEQEGRRFLDEAWSRIGAGYASLQLADAQGQTLYDAGREGEGPAPSRGVLDPAEQPVHDLLTGRLIGTVRLRPILEALVPVDVIATGFGDQGVGMVLDRVSGRILFHSSDVVHPLSINDILGAGFKPSQLDAPNGTFRYQARDTLRVAAYATISALPWIVVMSGAVSEFAAPFEDVGRTTLLLFLAVAVLATVTFGTFLRRTTRSLEELTAAAAVVGGGDFSPRLPAAGRDEVGRLTTSFEGMVARVRDMMDETRASRQMAVLGEFAAQLSHEIRNPLTAIKLNLQKIERVTRDTGALAETARPLEIALREVGRLDGVVRGVLDLARQEPEPRKLASLHALVSETLDLVRDQAGAQGVRIAATLAASQDQLLLSPGRIKGALLNLFLNALEAMPSGGVLQVNSSEGDGKIELLVADTGPGIHVEQRAAIFRPFATTKPGGTGLGLPLARRTIEEHGGTLSVVESNHGAKLLIQLPRSNA